MKKIVLLLFFLSPILSSAQIFALKITNLETGEISYIKEHKRVKIQTVNNQTLRGRLGFTDENTLTLNNTDISLNEVGVIQKQSLGKILTSWVLIGVGAMALGFSAILVIVDASAAGIVAGSSILVGVVGILLPNLSKKYKTKNFILEIVEVNPLNEK